MSRRAVTVLLPAALAALAAGCVGSTEPATEVGPHSAKLNAFGHADDGPAYSYFETWRTAAGNNPLTRSQTPWRSWPAGARGPLSETVEPLLAGTTYSFRVCGGDAGQQPVCAQERTFTTATPGTKDVVLGRWAGGVQRPEPTFSVSATSTPSGGSPTGSYQENGTSRTFRGQVTCVAVNGSRAAIGAVGEGAEFDNPTQRPQTRLVTLVDGGAGGQDTVGVVRTEGGTPPTCAGASFANQGVPSFHGDVAIQDVR